VTGPRRMRPQPRPTGGRQETVLGGRRTVLEAIRAGLVDEVLVALTARSTSGLRELRAEAARAGVPVREAPGRSVDSLAHDHQGVVARVRLPRPLGERELRTWAFEADGVVLVLDGVVDPQNVGAAARVGEAAGLSLLVLRERRGAGVTPAAVRASAGALLHLAHARVPNVTRALEILKDRGFFVIGLDEMATTSILDTECPPGPIALVVGSEGSGISRLVRETCDQLVRLPMAGRVASLNASSAVAAALYGYVLRRR
jgi:23S rRNA (guanosine2251-2'-O)-methyltransferase